MLAIEDSWVEVSRVHQKVDFNTDKCEMSLRKVHSNEINDFDAESRIIWVAATPSLENNNAKIFSLRSIRTQNIYVLLRRSTEHTTKNEIIYHREFITRSRRWSDGHTHTHTHTLAVDTRPRRWRMRAYVSLIHIACVRSFAKHGQSNTIVKDGSQMG